VANHVYAAAMARLLRQQAANLSVPPELLGLHTPDDTAPTVDETLARIDSATGCRQCGNPLGPSPSDDFCGEGCQHAWHAGMRMPKALTEPALNPSNSVMALFNGGPLHNTRQPLPLARGGPPMEWRCAEPPAPITPAVPCEDDLIPASRMGVYYFKGGTLAGYSLPEPRRWVEAYYLWQGWR
jgi:hypothetical protein